MVMLSVRRRVLLFLLLPSSLRSCRVVWPKDAALHYPEPLHDLVMACLKARGRGRCTSVGAGSVPAAVLPEANIPRGGSKNTGSELLSACSKFFDE